VFDAVFMLVAGILTTLLGFGVIGKGPKWHSWRRRFGRLFKIIGPLLVAVAVALAIGQRLTSPPLLDPSIQLVNRTLVSEPLGLRLTLPVDWVVQPKQSGADVIALHRKTGSVLVGTAMTSSPAKQPLSEVLDEVLEGRKKKWGSVRDVRRGKSKLGPLSAEWIGFSVPRGQGWVRSVTTLARKGPYALSLSCSDPPDAPACQDLVTSAVTVE